MRKNKFTSLILLLLPLLLLAVAAQAATCPNCGAAVESGVQFCGQCGTHIPTEPTPQPSEPRPDVSPRNPEIPDVAGPGSLDPSIDKLIGRLSDQELRRVVYLMLERMESRQDFYAPKPNSVAMMSREELEYLLRKYVGPPVKAEVSPFGAFLQFVGGATLLVLGIMIIAAF